VVIILLYQCSLFLLSICRTACGVENQSYRFEAEICSVDRSVTQIEKDHLSLPDNRGINLLSLLGECVVDERKTKECLVPTLLAPLILHVQADDWHSVNFFSCLTSSHINVYVLM